MTEKPTEYEPLDQSVRYAPANYCIYCGATDTRLTLEHTFPDGLGGRHKLPKACCEPCRKTINEEFEQYCLRELFGNIRMHLGIVSSKRKRKKRPAPPMKTQVTDWSGKMVDLYHDLREMPVIFVMPAFPEPTFLSGAKPTRFIKGANWVFNMENVEEYRRRQNAEGVVSPQIAPKRLARFLAKIAHAHATALLRDSFEPVLPDVILGRNERWNEYVGGSLDTYPRDEVYDHFLAFGAGQRKIDGLSYAFATIRLFGALGTPVYHVVLGALKDELPPLPHVCQKSGA